MHDRHATPRDTHAQTRLDPHERRQGTQEGPITTFEQKVAVARPRLLRLAQLNDVPLDAVRFIPVGAWGAREITEYESCANYSRSP